MRQETPRQPLTCFSSIEFQRLDSRYLRRQQTLKKSEKYDAILYYKHMQSDWPDESRVKFEIKNNVAKMWAGIPPVVMNPHSEKKKVKGYRGIPQTRSNVKCPVLLLSAHCFGRVRSRLFLSYCCCCKDRENGPHKTQNHTHPDRYDDAACGSPRSFFGLWRV